MTVSNRAKDENSNVIIYQHYYYVVQSCYLYAKITKNQQLQITNLENGLLTGYQWNPFNDIQTI